MSDDCFFNPAACEEVEPEPEVVDEPTEEVAAEEGEMDEMESDDEMETGGLMPQIAFLGTAGALMAYSGVQVFARRLSLVTMQATNTDGDEEDQLLYFAAENALVALEEDAYTTKYWTLANTIGLWSMFIVSSAKFVFQALSMLGIMGGLNLTVWHYGMMAMDIVGLVTGVLMFMSYNKCYSVLVEETEDDNTLDEDTHDNTLVGAAATVLASVEADSVWHSVMGSAVMANLMIYYKGWIMGQLAMLPEEEAEAWEEALGMGKDDEEEDDMHLFARFHRRF